MSDYGGRRAGGGGAGREGGGGRGGACRMLLWPADLQLQVVLFGSKLIHEGVSLAMVERQILGRDVRRTELHQRHGVCEW